MNFKKELTRIFLGLCYIIGLIWFIRFFQLGFWGIFITLLGSSLMMRAYKWYKTKKAPTIKGILKSAIMLLLFLLFMRYVIGYIFGFGLKGFIIGCLLITIFILFRRRQKYLEVKHQIEGMIWGKPLKEFKSSKDLPKVKISLKK